MPNSATAVTTTAVMILTPLAALVAYAISFDLAVRRK
jgi:hypothetical protein